ncbi:HNH endonuclease [Vibrio fluvialis]|uniref:HNH endonuclease n=1 Tax=Vibrio fluvialis TaxID=676 RepID=UPI003D7E3BE2
MTINQVERAYKAWPILAQRAKSRKTITYKELGDAIGVHHRVIRFVLGVIQDYCMAEKIPPLTILIINSTGKPGVGFIAYDLRNFEYGLQEVFDYDWENHGNPFVFSLEGLSYKNIINSLVDEPDSSGEIYGKVKSRGIRQMLFRQALLKAYSHRCAFTGLSFVHGLEAAHIVPWKHATDSQRMDVRNGILLNSFHHRLFDAGLITLSSEYKILYYDQNGRDGSYSKLDRLMSTDLHGKTIYLPHKVKNRPSRVLISDHNRLLEWEE